VVNAKFGTNDAREEEIAVLCHELRNSLAVVRGVARLLRSPAATNQLENARALLERHVCHMSQHIDDLSRRGRPGRGLHLSKIDLRAVARHAVDAIGPEMARRRHRLAVKLPEEPVWTHADGARLEQAFSNLLINAAKYTADGGDIALDLEPEDGQVRVRIKDTGVGIEAPMLAQVFGMFVQVGTAPPSSGSGRGIGLAVVKHLVELHGGSVKATSAGLGSGSEFTDVLPAL
jgi:signal transduction histidine kinase